MFVVLYLFCFDLINYLEKHTVLYKVDRHSDDRHSSNVKCRLLLNTNEHGKQFQQHPKKRVNIVISDMDTTNTCDRPLVRLFWKICCEWNCASVLFQKFQVKYFIFEVHKSIDRLKIFRLLSHFLYWMHLLIYL